MNSIVWTTVQRMDGQNTDNVQFFVWHGSQNLCQTITHSVMPYLSIPRITSQLFLDDLRWHYSTVSDWSVIAGYYHLLCCMGPVTDNPLSLTQSPRSKEISSLWQNWVTDVPCDLSPTSHRQVTDRWMYLDVINQWRHVARQLPSCASYIRVTSYLIDRCQWYLCLTWQTHVKSPWVGDCPGAVWIPVGDSF